MQAVQKKEALIAQKERERSAILHSREVQAAEQLRNAELVAAQLEQQREQRHREELLLEEKREHEKESRRFLRLFQSMIL